MRCFQYIFFFTLSVSLSSAQNGKEKFYFDKSGKTSNKNEAYYFRQETDTAGFFRAYFLSNDNLAFQGRITKADNTDDSKSVFAGECIWKYKNGNNRMIRSFDDNGVETGISKYYYENGIIWKEMEFVKGKLKDKTYYEYEENGSKNKIFEEDFNNNDNDWDIYASDKSQATIKDSYFELTAFGNQGTSRYVNFPVTSNYYAVESDLYFTNLKDLKENDKIGLIFGFKDWQNYYYFVISRRNVYIGGMFEGIKINEIDGMGCAHINPTDKNTLKIITTGEKTYYSVNGQIQYSHKASKLLRSNFGFIVSGKGQLKASNLIIKEIDTHSSKTDGSPSDANVKATGSGLIISTNGIIITNHHVIDNSNSFLVELTTDAGKQVFKAELLQKDKENDLAILKIKDPSFKDFTNINYSFKEQGSVDVGSSVFTIGFPYALTGMGKEAKFTDGKVSAKTGYNGAINSFQTSIPVQPGNSGGPVFNDKGQLVGLINSGILEADNVSYAIKLNYINNIIELLNEEVIKPSDNSISSLSLEEKVKVLTKYVVLIKVK